MKKSLLIVSVLVLFQLSSNAQVSFGPVIGLNFTSLNSLSYIDYTNEGHRNLLFGGTFNYKLNDYVRLSPELLFCRKGGTIKLNSSSSGMTRTDIYNLSYINMPLTAKIGYSPDDVMFIYGIAGPYLGYVVGGMASEEGSGGVTYKEYKLDDFFTKRSQDFSKFDIGLSLGAGISFLVGEGNMFLNMKFEPGFITIASDQTIVPYFYHEIGKNSCFNLSAGYLIEL